MDVGGSMVMNGTAVSSRSGRSAAPAAAVASATTSGGKRSGTSCSRRTAANRASRVFDVSLGSLAGRKTMCRWAMWLTLGPITGRPSMEGPSARAPGST